MAAAKTTLGSRHTVFIVCSLSHMYIFVNQSFTNNTNMYIKNKEYKQTAHDVFNYHCIFYYRHCKAGVPFNLMCIYDLIEKSITSNLRLK